MSWRDGLPELAAELARRWSLTLGPEWVGQGTCSWVAPATLADGTAAVLKLGMPHMEGEHEIAGLRFWDGDPFVRLLDADVEHNAMLLERCEPCTPLSELPEPEQDVVIAGLLQRVWRDPVPDTHCRPLEEMLAYWSACTLADEAKWHDPGLVREGLALFGELSRTTPRRAMLATDLHAGNVLRAAREPWLAIDPKPFTGDPAYDATQHLLNCPARLRADALGTIRRFADLLELDAERVRLWLFARLAAEPGGDREEHGLVTLLAR